MVDNSVIDAMIEMEEAIGEAFGSEIVIVSGENNTFSITGIDNALLTVPQGGRLYVSPVTLDSARHEEAEGIGITAEQLAEAETFDVTLMNSDGEVVQLSAPVRIHFNISERMQGKQLKVVHYHNEQEAELLDVTVSGNVGSFITRSFSEFALVATEEIGSGDTNNSSQDSNDTIIDTIFRSTFAQDWR